MFERNSEIYPSPKGMYIDVPVYNILCGKAFGDGAKLAAYHLQMYGVVPARQRQGIGRVELVKVVEDKVCCLISVVLLKFSFLTISHR